jgi:hypothetical protein
MKLFMSLLFSLYISNVFAAQEVQEHELSIIKKIDDIEFSRNYVEVSEEGLPRSHYIHLISLMNAFSFTLLSDSKIRDIFEDLTTDPKARNKIPGGRCSYRRAHIQNYLKKMNIISGKFLIKCPAHNGRLRLKDQVTRRYYSYANFHDTNIVAVQTNTGHGFRILDLQFQDSPVSLQEYLTEIEASQRIRPLKRKGTTSSLCYWTISTPQLTY